MSVKNLTAMLAGIVMLLVFGGFTIYGYIWLHQTFAVTWAVIAGIMLANLDWVRRKPGRVHNQHHANIARVIGIAGGPIVHVLLGSHTQFSFTVYVSALCLPLVLYLLIVVIIDVRPRRGYWRR